MTFILEGPVAYKADQSGFSLRVLKGKAAKKFSAAKKPKKAKAKAKAKPKKKAKAKPKKKAKAKPKKKAKAKKH